MERKILVMEANDNVGVVLEAATDGDTCQHSGRRIDIRDDIAFGHKVALEDIAVRCPVIKYGQEIGHAEIGIAVGQWVHVHNMGCNRGK